MVLAQTTKVARPLRGRADRFRGSEIYWLMWTIFAGGKPLKWVEEATL
jgi:hypothetical protein